MTMLKTFKEMYYIEHTIWNKYFDKDKIPLFKDIKYDDIIILHFDFLYSVFKTKTSKQKVDKTIIVDAINICLRMYQKIKTVYPYNKLYVIIHADKHSMGTLIIDTEAFQKLIDIIPDFALVSNKDDPDLDYYKSDCYKHIIYGTCNGVKNKYKAKNCQTWRILNGKLYITGLN